MPTFRCIRLSWHIEVTHISRHGFWLLLGEKEELLLPFAQFPWFRQAVMVKFFRTNRSGKKRVSGFSGKL
jgi:hypothetical protein